MGYTITSPVLKFALGFAGLTATPGGGGGDGGGGGTPGVANPLPVYLSGPVDADIVATARPTFIVAVDVDDEDAPWTVEVRYSSSSTMTSPVTLSDDFAGIDGGTSLTAQADLSGTVWWQARVLSAGTARSDWVGPQSFTVSTTATTATLPVTWTVTDGGTRSIHLWHFTPPGPDVDDTVTVYGQGFPTSGHLSFGELRLTVLSWKLLMQTDQVDNPGRTINGDTVDPEHYEVVFTAPAYNGPGEPLTVET